MRRLFFSALATLALGGCTSNCLKLAQKICDCQPTSTLRDSCNSDASAQKAQLTLTSGDEDRCAKLLDRCDCHALDTPEGKVSCGQARAYP